jgi:hypothetical protein
MLGTYTDFVPSHAMKSTGLGKWKPERITVALAADTIPAIIAPPGRRIPNSTTVASQSRPVWVG